MEHDLQAVGKRLQQQAASTIKQAPVHLWSPGLNGDLDMRIAADGRWFYQGGEIKRIKLIQLFSSILKREDDDIFLVTPVEKWRIQVDRQVFCLTDFEISELEGVDTIRFSNGLGEEALLTVENPIWFITENGQDVPCIQVRDGLAGSLARSVFYRLVELGEERDGELFIPSAGVDFSLGKTL